MNISNRDLLDQAIEAYFRALYECNLDLFDQVFHDQSSLFDADDGRCNVEPIASFRHTIANRVSPMSTGMSREDEVLSVDWLSDVSAVVKVRLRSHANLFVDHLSFVKANGEFRIVSKVWHLEKVIDS